MTREFDPKKSYLSLKAHERMLAHASFLVRCGDDDTGKEGIIKISSFQRPYGGGHLTLTFIVDTGGNDRLKKQLSQVFNKLTDASFRSKMGKNFERIVKVSLNSLTNIHDWYVEEVNIHFRSIDERENILIEEKLIPALESAMPCTFDAVEWWPENRTPRTPSSQEIAGQGSLKSLFKKWFKSG
jgi:hypothetical protein